MHVDTMQERLEQAQARVHMLEQMLEDRTRQVSLANQELRASNEFLSQVIASMAGGLVVVDADRRILMVNRRLRGLTGFMDEELIGQPVQNVLPGAGRFRPADSDTADEEETWLRTAHGDIPVSLTHGALDGTRTGHVYVVIDARARKATEEALREAQDALVQASRRAGMAEVATGVIHEVGNVLTPVNVGLRQLREASVRSKVASLRRIADWLQDAQHHGDWTTTPGGNRVPEFLSTLSVTLGDEQHARIQKLDRLLGHLDHVTQIVVTQQSRAQDTVVLQHIQVAALLGECVDLLWSRVQGLAVQVWTFADPSLSIRSDPHQLRLILGNVISNALDAMQGASSERSLRVSATREDSTAVFRIRDSGRGIRAEDLARIFAHGFTTRREGHGFGLHAAANAATQLGGTLEAHSDGPGTGAEFTLKVPDRNLVEVS